MRPRVQQCRGLEPLVKGAAAGAPPFSPAACQTEGTHYGPSLRPLSSRTAFSEAQAIGPVLVGASDHRSVIRQQPPLCRP